MEEGSLKDLISKIKKQTESIPIQKVVLHTKKSEKEVQVLFYTTKEKLKLIKTKALQNDMSMKELINKSLDEYLLK